MLKDMFIEAAIPADGNTNHSLRATATTRMMDAGLCEKLIMDRHLIQEQLIVRSKRYCWLLVVTHVQLKLLIKA